MSRADREGMIADLEHQGRELARSLAALDGEIAGMKGRERAEATSRKEAMAEELAELDRRVKELQKENRRLSALESE